MKELLALLAPFIIVCSTLVVGVYNGYKHEEKMASLGYIEVQCIGTSDTIWVKP